jgi:hypothetical protein
MKEFARIAAFSLMSGLSLCLAACGGGSGSNIGGGSNTSTFVLTVASVNPASGAAIAVSPSDNNSLGNGSSSFSRTYNSGTTITLTAAATAGGNNFTSWTGCTAASTVTCTVTLGANTTVTANYATPAPTVYTLTVNSTNPASGVAIAVSPSDNNSLGNGSSSFTRNYNSGATVTLTAAATAGGNNFSSWTGCTAATAETCTVNIGANTTVTANYTTPAYTLTINSSNPASGVAIAVSPSDNNSLGNGSSSFTRNYNSGATVTLTAAATAGGNIFSLWTGCTTATTETCTVNIGANTTVTANYTTPAYTLTVDSSNPASGVAIAVSPSDNNSKGSGSTGFTRTYNAGTTITLIAPSTASGNNFSSWSGCTLASAFTCSVALTANTTVTANYVVTPPTVYTLTVSSSNPASGVAIAVSPSDKNSLGNGSSSFTRSYNSGTSITLTAPATASGNTFSSWSGCTAVSTLTCTVNIAANTTVTAAYTTPVAGVTSVSVTPATVTIGTQQQFTATVSGNGSYATTVTWAIAAPAGSSLSPGTITSAGLYTAPYPAPATVTVTATSTQDTSKSGSVTVTLAPPATAAGPALSVDAGNQTHAINPYIYGWNGWSINTGAAQAANITIDRWGGDNTTPYNYLLDVSNNGSDWYFENSTLGGGTKDNSAFNHQVNSDLSIGARTLGSVPLLGYVAKSGSGCSFSVAKYGAQEATGTGEQQQADDPYNTNCGSGVLTNGKKVANDPSDTYTPIDGTFVGGWINYLVSTFGTAANGGVAIYDLDNEPSWWDAVHVDEHPVAATYDEMTSSGLAAAKAVKVADASAAVSGPVMDYWWDYFYSKKDIESGWNSGSPCWQPWSNPVDRLAHGGVPFIEYYLQQFAAASATANQRLLDYLDLHTYFAATYNGSGVGLTTAGDTGEQQARLNSTRVFWDPTYTDPNFPQPNYTTDANYTSSCNVPLQAPQVIPMMKAWVAKDYPGTKTAITEYNWGGQENINGAVAQADILGIFGREGLDLGTLWGPPDPTTQVPGLMAFEIYRNYDGNKSVFGNMALASSSANQGQLSVYGALRSADNAVTVVVINKTYGALTSTLTLPNLTPNGTAKAFLYSNANLNAIVAQAAVTVTPPAAGGTTSSIGGYTFPAQSITLFVVPQQ